MPRDVMHRMRRILFVGSVNQPGVSVDTHILSQLIARDLLDFITVETAVAALDILAKRVRLFDAILINSVLPDCDAAMLCARLRRRDIHIPVLILGADDSEMDVVRGLDAGANDYLCAPFRAAEICARLRAQIRAYETSDEAVLPIGPFEFRPGSRVLVRRSTGVRVRLTDKEAAVLKFLYRSDMPVSRTTLLHEVWGYNARATTHTVETHIYRLRRKLEPLAGKITLLINEDGGYLLARHHDLHDLGESARREPHIAKLPVFRPLHATAQVGF